MEIFKYETVQIISFDDECACLSQLLAIKDKLIYVVVSATFSNFVVPLIHDHKFIEHVYIHQNCNFEESIDWMEDYPKIRSNRSSIDLLTKKINKDIDSVMKRPTRWSRSKALLTELCSQAPHTNIPSSINTATEDDLNTWRIVVLNLDSHRSLKLSHPKIRINKFDNMKECIRSIETGQTSVFLIISMNCFKDIRSLAELDAIHALYIVSNLNSKEQIEMLSMYSKLSGIFAPKEDLLEQLTTDIYFYHHMRVCTPKMSVFKIESNILGKLNDTQKDFLCFQLFSDILSQLPIHSRSAPVDHMKTDNQILSCLIEANLKIIYLSNQLDIFTQPKSIVELHNINRQIDSMTKNNNNTSSVTIYRVQLASKEDIEILENNSNALLAIHAYVLASRSFQSIAKICRRAVNSQLTVVLFEIKLFDKAFVASINSDIVVFKRGTLFRLVSVDPGPDGIWRVQLEIENTAMWRIKDQLRIEIGSYLTWLTFGNYLSAFKRFNAAQQYFEYLQQVLPLEDPGLASIYNNMGLMYWEKQNDKAALKLFKKVLKMKIPELPAQDKQKTLSSLDLPPPQSTSFNRISILNKLAEINCHLENREASLGYYRQALQIATDAKSRQYYEAKIRELLFF
jgi:tetratricopeptide (TPR) repeat protein